MNVFGVGPLEMMLVAVIAIVVLGPERFPQAAVQVAKAIKFLRGYATEATSDLREEFKELTKEYEDLRKELNEIKRDGVQAATVTTEISKAQREARTAIRQAKAPDLKQLMSPIIEPGGELPPERNGTGSPNGKAPDKTP